MVEPHYLKVDILLSYNPGNMLGHESSLIHFSKMCLYEKSLCVCSIYKSTWQSSERKVKEEMAVCHSFWFT